GHDAGAEVLADVPVGLVGMAVEVLDDVVVEGERREGGAPPHQERGQAWALPHLDHVVPEVRREAADRAMVAHDNRRVGPGRFRGLGGSGGRGRLRCWGGGGSWAAARPPAPAQEQRATRAGNALRRRTGRWIMSQRLTAGRPVKWDQRSSSWEAERIPNGGSARLQGLLDARGEELEQAAPRVRFPCDPL